MNHPEQPQTPAHPSAPPHRSSLIAAQVLYGSAPDLPARTRRLRLDAAR